VVKNLLTLVSDTFQKLRLKVSALLSTLRQRVAKRAGQKSRTTIRKATKTIAKKTAGFR
jgi:hypothetical protein